MGGDIITTLRGLCLLLHTGQHAMTTAGRGFVLQMVVVNMGGTPFSSLLFFHGCHHYSGIFPHLPRFCRGTTTEGKEEHWWYGIR